MIFLRGTTWIAAWCVARSVHSIDVLIARLISDDSRHIFQGLPLLSATFLVVRRAVWCGTGCCATLRDALVVVTKHNVTSPNQSTTQILKLVTHYVPISIVLSARSQVYFRASGLLFLVLLLKYSCNETTFFLHNRHGTVKDSTSQQGSRPGF